MNSLSKDRAGRFGLMGLFRPVAGLVCLFLLLPLPVGAQGGTAVVHVVPPGLDVGSADSSACGSAEHPCTSLQAAIDIAQAGGILRLATGIYTGNGDAVLTLTQPKSVTVIGGYDPDTWTMSLVSGATTIIDGQGVRRGVYISNTYNLTTLENVIVRNGYANKRIGAWGPMGGGLLCLQNASVRLRNVTFSNNQVWAPDTEAVGGGGAAFLWGGPGAPCPVTMENVTFDGNEVHAGSTTNAPRGGHGLGGGFFVTHSDLTAVNVVLTDNQVWGGNGGNGGADSHLGRADALGGGAAIQYSNSYLTNVLATDNHTYAGRGGDYGGSGAGGGLFLELGTGTIISVTLRNNSVRGGDSPAGTGGIGAGGGLMTERQILTLDRTWVISNTSRGGDGLNSGHAGGGGIYLTQPRGSEPAPSQLTATNVVVANNTAQAGTGADRWGGGGGIFSQNTVLRLYHATVVSNTILSTMSGSGIVVLHDAGVGTSQADISNSIIAGHHGSLANSDALLSQDAGTVVNLRRTLFFDNTNDTGTRYGAVINETHSSHGDPALVAPGAPIFDYHLTNTSAAINAAGVTLSDHDADGRSRPSGGRSDTGAYELELPVTMTSWSSPRYVVAGGDPTHSVTQWVLLQNGGGRSISATLTVQLPTPDPPLSLTLKEGIGEVASGDDSGGTTWDGNIPALGEVRLSFTCLLTVPETYTGTAGMVSRIGLSYVDGEGKSYVDDLESPLTVNVVPLRLPVILH